MVDFEKLDDDFFNREWDGDVATLASHVGGNRGWTPAMRWLRGTLCIALAGWCAANLLMVAEMTGLVR